MPCIQCDTYGKTTNPSRNREYSPPEAGVPAEETAEPSRFAATQARAEPPMTRPVGPEAWPEDPPMMAQPGSAPGGETNGTGEKAGPEDERRAQLTLQRPLNPRQTDVASKDDRPIINRRRHHAGAPKTETTNSNR